MAQLGWALARLGSRHCGLREVELQGADLVAEVGAQGRCVLGAGERAHPQCSPLALGAGRAHLVVTHTQRCDLVNPLALEVERAGRGGGLDCEGACSTGPSLWQ